MEKLESQSMEELSLDEMENLEGGQTGQGDNWIGLRPEIKWDTERDDADLGVAFRIYV